MIRNIFALGFCLIASAAIAADTPTLADSTVSVLKTDTVTATTATAAIPAAAPAACCCETAKEVKLTPGQTRRLSRQADRQEARECRKATVIIVSSACNCK